MPADGGAAAVKEELTPQQVQALYQQLEKECSAIINKIAELEQEEKEHALVLKAFQKVEPSRRCFRMVGGVLVERTVAEVTPAVDSNQEKIKQAMAQLEQNLKKKTEQRAQFMEKHGLNRQANQGQAAQQQQPQEAQRPAGGSVLV
mmetsp:Transcript_42850/g.99219  ORF Transcript_42850/g.99219 Transcript_42850/m.99219 type:complete len:146 (-) Transcript_42850:153-590(-)|eukprot:CAMPEP_0171108802 /NCGR_PEP_ID=MMETSP0766_2-20121228/69643_1 /TAXON_ID=439317 /ORGANISM="Gambierdiscus australes, Strain CAWD 149" /LENGTH=145 /DNA_ID=CAMNT_0011570407 /DNA_START=69 /DNA_END=506 /DNA_ORIENTATION=+